MIQIKPLQMSVLFIILGGIVSFASMKLTIAYLPQAQAESIEKELIEKKNNNQINNNSAVLPPVPDESQNLKPISTEKSVSNVESNPVYVYESKGKRDLFRPFEAFLENSSLRDNVNDSKFPLTKYTLESLTVVAILWDTNKPKALIRAPDNELYAVFKRDLIGRNNGFIAAIREGELVVIEKYYFDGQSKLKTKILELKK